MWRADTGGAWPGQREWCVSGPTAMRTSCASRLGLRDLLAETVICAAPAAPPGRAGPEQQLLPVPASSGSGALLAVCFDEAFDKLVDIARLG
jgi:hypothetical protein